MGEKLSIRFSLFSYFLLVSHEDLKVIPLNLSKEINTSRSKYSNKLHDNISTQNKRLTISFDGACYANSSFLATYFCMKNVTQRTFIHKTRHNEDERQICPVSGP